MKNCQICLSVGHADDVPTCPHCGEASWEATSEQSAKPSAPVKARKKAEKAQPAQATMDTGTPDPAKG